MPTMVQIGGKIKRLRTERLLTPAQLAERAGIGVNTIYRIERNEVDPHFETIRRLGNALDIEPGELVKEDK